PFMFYRHPSAPISTLFPYTTLFRSKEVLAQSMAGKIVDPPFPNVNHDLRFLVAHYPSAYAVDRTAGTHPICGESDECRPSDPPQDRKSTRLNSSHRTVSYSLFFLKK